jgi:hypothetical protein
MFFTTRLCVFVVLAIAGAIAWHTHAVIDTPHEPTQLALQQFQNDAALPEKLQRAALAQNWWPLVWPAVIVLLGVVMFWDDVERWWKGQSQCRRLEVGGQTEDGNELHETKLEDFA